MREAMQRTARVVDLAILVMAGVASGKDRPMPDHKPLELGDGRGNYIDRAWTVEVRSKEPRTLPAVGAPLSKLKISG
jgi:hypothetical protein